MATTPRPNSAPNPKIEDEYNALNEISEDSKLSPYNFGNLDTRIWRTSPILQQKSRT